MKSMYKYNTRIKLLQLKSQSLTTSKYMQGQQMIKETVVLRCMTNSNVKGIYT